MFREHYRRPARHLTRFKLATIVFKRFNTLAPAYLAYDDYVSVSSVCSRPHLRSPGTRTLVPRRTRTVGLLGARDLAASSVVISNSYPRLLSELRLCMTAVTFAGRPPPWPHCVRWGSSPPPPEGHNPNFRPIPVVAKWLDGSRYHLVGR